MVALLAAGLIALPADTTLSVARGESLVLGTRDGSISVGVWSRNEVRVDGRVGLRRQGSTIELSDGGRRPRRVEMRVTVPEWMRVQIEGQEVDVDAEGLVGAEIRTFSGEVVLTEVRNVDVRTISGDVDVRALSGDSRIVTVSGDVRLVGASGRLELRSTDGDLEAIDVEASEYLAETTDGDVVFEGVIPRGSRIRLATHDGDVSARIPPDADVEIRVSTFDGAFIPGFPVRASGFRAGEAVTFVLGAGGAELEMQAFDGDLRLDHSSGGR